MIREKLFLVKSENKNHPRKHISNTDREIVPGDNIIQMKKKNSEKSFELTFYILYVMCALFLEKYTLKLLPLFDTDLSPNGKSEFFYRNDCGGPFTPFSFGIQMLQMRCACKMMNNKLLKMMMKIFIYK